MLQALNDGDAHPLPAGSPEEAVFLQVTDGTIKGIEFVKEYALKIASGTGVPFDPVLAG